MATTTRSIPGLPGFHAGRDGSIWKNLVGGGRQELRQFRVGGYPNVSIGRKQRAVHRLVLLAWKGQPGEGQTDGRHLDGDPGNNRLSNLAWGTRKENRTDAMRHIRVAYLHRRGYSDREIARMCKLKPRIVRVVIERRCSAIDRSDRRVNSRKYPT